MFSAVFSLVTETLLQPSNSKRSTANTFLSDIYASESSSDEEAEEKPDELDRYLATECDRNAPDDALLWWWEHRHVYPRLSRMAADYLTIPGKCYLVIYRGPY